MGFWSFPLSWLGTPKKTPKKRSLVFMENPVIESLDDGGYATSRNLSTNVTRSATQRELLRSVYIHIYSHPQSQMEKSITIELVGIQSFPSMTGHDYIYIHIYIYIYTYIHIHTYIYMYTHTHISSIVSLYHLQKRVAKKLLDSMTRRAEKIQS